VIALRKLLDPNIFERMLGELSDGSFVNDLRCIEGLGEQFVVPGSTPSFLLPILERVCRKVLPELRRKPLRVWTSYGYVQCVQRVIPVKGVFWLVEDCRLVGDREDAVGLGDELVAWFSGRSPRRFSLSSRRRVVVLV